MEGKRPLHHFLPIVTCFTSGDFFLDIHLITFPLIVGLSFKLFFHKLVHFWQVS